jgi:hypothetical protein
MVEVTESAVSVVVEAAKVAEPLVGLSGDRRDDDPSAQGEKGQRDRNRLVDKCAHSDFPPLAGRPRVPRANGPEVSRIAVIRRKVNKDRRGL